MSFDPYIYQRELIEKAKISNERGQAIINKAIEDGLTVVPWTRLSGPYTTYVGYLISDGTVVQMIEPARLHWVDLTILGGFK